MAARVCLCLLALVALSSGWRVLAWRGSAVNGTCVRTNNIFDRIGSGSSCQGVGTPFGGSMIVDDNTELTNGTTRSPRTGFFVLQSWSGGDCKLPGSSSTASGNYGASVDVPNGWPGQTEPFCFTVNAAAARVAAALTVALLVVALL